MLEPAALPDVLEQQFVEAAAQALRRDEAAAARQLAFERTDLWCCPFTVVDVETTGGLAGEDGVTEIALVQVCEGRIAQRWRSFVNPLQPIPPFITRLTGITNEMVANAPPIRNLLPHVLGFIGDSILVGHNVRFDAAFIERELERHNLGILDNPKVDTLLLARRTIAEVPNYKLGTLTRELGIDVERHHRALTDATATAELLVHCIKKLEDCGVFTYGALQDFLHAHGAARRRNSARRTFGNVTQLHVWTSVLIAEASVVPRKPGVYLLKNVADEVLYVGKSRNLRQRIRAYTSRGRPASGKIRVLRGAMAAFDYLTTGSEFEALLLEAELVRAHNPPFNERLRDFRSLAFIKVEAGPYGRLVATTRLRADGGKYHGPYSSTSATRRAVEALQDAIGLRSCDVPAHGEPRTPQAQHEALLQQALAFLRGEHDEVLLAVARRRDEAAARMKLEVAQREERRLERLRRLRQRTAALEFATGLSVLVMAPSRDPASEACFLFCRGRLAAQQMLPRRLAQREEARRLLAAILADKFRPQDAPRAFARQDEIDQLYLLCAWYRDRREGLTYVDLPDRRPEQDEADVWATAVLDGRPIEM